MASLKEKSITGFLWRFMQNAGSQVINFVVSIVLARILAPEDYGLIAMITVFTNIAMVFINVGFSSTIIQKKELSEMDINTVFYTGLMTATIIYVILFLGAPFIADFYHEEKLSALLRVESLMVLFGGLYSVHHALIIRRLEFKKSFVISFIGVITHGIVGIVLALLGFGPWALVLSTIANFFVCCILNWIVVKWRPGLMFSKESAKYIFSFSGKVLGSELLNSVFNNIRSLIIGRQYSSQDLAYYNRGYQFPTLVMNQVDGATTTVLFSALSKYQSDWENRGLSALRRAMKTSLYICAPLLFGLSAVAEPMIAIILTEKWLPCVEYVRLVSMMCLFWPLSAQRHALNSLGRSDISLKLNMLTKIITIIVLFATYKISVSAMILGSIGVSLISYVISSFFYRKYLLYKISDQLKDIMPPIILAAIMFVAAYSISFIGLSYIATLILQVIVGVAVYILGSLIFRIDSFFYVLDILKGFLKKKS